MRGRHAVMTFRKQMWGGVAARLQKLGEGKRQSVYQENTPLNGHSKSKMVNLLHFKVQQVAVNLVVDIGIIFLLAQVKAGDIHRRLKKDTYCWLIKFYQKYKKSENQNLQMLLCNLLAKDKIIAMSD